jgi:hypothetical protein
MARNLPRNLKRLSKTKRTFVRTDVSRCYKEGTLPLIKPVIDEAAALSRHPESFLGIQISLTVATPHLFLAENTPLDLSQHVSW